MNTKQQEFPRSMIRNSMQKSFLKPRKILNHE